MKVLLVVAARSGSGKTTLVEGMLPHLRAAGLRVAAVKRTHHAVDLDRPGKDTRRLRDAGASPVALSGPGGWTGFFAEPGGDAIAAVVRTLAVSARPDLVLVEGGASLPRRRRIEVVPPGGEVATRPHALLLAVVRSERDGRRGTRAPRGVPVFHRDDAAGVAALVAAWALGRRSGASRRRPRPGLSSPASPEGPRR